MVRIFRHYVPRPILALAACELLILYLSIQTAIYLRYAPSEGLSGTAADHIGKMVTFTLVFGVAMFALGLYQREYIRDYRIVFIRLATSCTTAFVFLSLVFYLVPELSIWRSALGVAVGFAVVFILATRALFLNVADLSRFKRRVLVMGVGVRAARVETLANDLSRGIVVVGFLPANEAVCAIAPERVLSGVESLAAFAREEGIEEIIVAIEDCRGNMPIEALLECKLNGIAVTEFATFCERQTGRVEVDSLNPSWMIFSDGFAVGQVQHAFKRLIDLAVALGLVVFTLPLIALTAAAIKMETPGPVFIRQQRVGRGGRSFMLYKFRSMRDDAEKDGVPRWAVADDPRITRVGAFIRKTRIDELPQIINVLKGDMSFVGPRPERSYFVDRLACEIPYYIECHRVRPGITGWAQLNYPYGNSVEDAKRKLEYDLYYLKNLSALLDLSILFQTARIVLWPNSAPRRAADTVIDVDAARGRKSAA